MPTSRGYGSVLSEIANAFLIQKINNCKILFIKPKSCVSSAHFYLRDNNKKILNDFIVLSFVLKVFFYMYIFFLSLVKFTNYKIKRIKRFPYVKFKLRKRKKINIRSKHFVNFRKNINKGILDLDLNIKGKDDSIFLNNILNRNQEIVTFHHRSISSELNKNEIRNSNLENYIPSLKYLSDQNFLIIKIGTESTNLDLNISNLIDLTKMKEENNQFMEWALIKKSKFMISTDSGAQILANLAGIPTLGTNSTSIIGFDEFAHKNDVFIYKKAHSLKENRILPISEMIDEEYLNNFRDPKQYSLIENSDEELLEATIEIVDLINNDIGVSDIQKKLLQLKKDYLNKSKIEYWNGKNYIKEPLFVSGRVCNKFLEKFLY
jgi:putative glycosyltransferase (TIGR04372 family)